MILYYNGIDLVEGLAPDEQRCEGGRQSAINGRWFHYAVK